MQRIVGAVSAMAMAVVPVAAQVVTMDGDLPRALRDLTPAGVRSGIVVKDDALDTVATLTTERSYHEKRGLLGTVPFDAFLRAFVEKRTGAVRYQVYFDHRYTARLYIRWLAVNYQTASGPATARLANLGRVRGACSRYRGCERWETTAFMIDETVLRSVAQAYRADATALWPFKLKGQDGSERIDGLAAAEVAGLLLAVDAYRARLAAAPR